MCQELIFSFSEALGEFMAVNAAYLSQLQVESNEEDLTDLSMQLLEQRIDSANRVFEIFKTVSMLAAAGHFENESEVENAFSSLKKNNLLS
jgi:hypothetical protein